MPVTKTQQDGQLHETIGVLKGGMTAIEKKFDEFRDDFKDLEKKVESQGKDLSTQMTIMKDELMTEIGVTKNALDPRIKKLELWQYMLIGGAIIIGTFCSSVIDNTLHRVINPQQTTIQLQAPQQQSPLLPQNIKP